MEQDSPGRGNSGLSTGWWEKVPGFGLFKVPAPEVMCEMFLSMPLYAALTEWSVGYTDLLDSANQSTSLQEIRANKNTSRKELEWRLLW